jgi:Predicted membrane protein
MQQKTLWINQIKGLCICLVVIYHSVITFYPHLNAFQHPWSETLSKCWIYFNLYLAPFRMPVFFFISGFLIRRYITDVPWQGCIDKRIWHIAYVLILWGALQWLALRQLNGWLAPERDLTHAANAAYANSPAEFIYGMLTASTSLWYLYALVVYFIFCKLSARMKGPLIIMLATLSIAINFIPSPWWGMNSVLRNVIYYALGAWYGTAIMTWLTTSLPRRAFIPLAIFALAAVVLYFKGIPLLMALLSIFVIMKLFWLASARFTVSSGNWLNVVGTNTIAIYTTHRILVEAASLVLIKQVNGHVLTATSELALLLTYPFLSLIICTLFGLLVRQLSRRVTGDLLFSPPEKRALAAS